MLYEDLGTDEECLVGSWLRRGSRVEGDFACKRINWLISERLEKISADATGWDTLWRDPRDGRLWELTYPQSSLHGGGPPKLELISRDAAQLKYEHSTA
jgi:immunity protein 27 of polymorphic toxin system